MRIKAYDKEGVLVADYIFADTNDAYTFKFKMNEKGYNTEVEQINV